MKRLHFQGIPIQNGDDFYAVNSCAAEPTGNYYFLSNDFLTLRLGKKKEMDGVVICGVANPHFFHVISLVSRVAPVRRVIAVDSNYEQLLHFKRIYTLILGSNNRIEFLQRLFKVTFNAKAIRILLSLRPSPENVVRGGVAQDHFFQLEREVWHNLHFNAEEFQTIYGLAASIGDGGLVIKSNTVGDINTYYATMICCSRSDYEYWPFTAGFCSGFLRDEEAFQGIRQILHTSPMYLLHDDFAEIYPDLLRSNRYQTLFVWCSNLISDYFITKHPKIEDIIKLSIQLGVQEEPNFPEIDLVLLQDERTYRPVPEIIDNRRRHRRNWSVHTRNFAVVSRYLRGANNLEVIGVKKWFDEDMGISKLPNTRYLLIDDFLSDASDVIRYDSIFLHILRGHGVSMESYVDILRKARNITDNLIILEHNHLSKDFRGTGIGVTVDEVRDILGIESFLDFGPGERCSDRNVILVFRN